MISRLQLFSLLLLWSLAICVQAEASNKPSFDCKRARSPIEHTICSDVPLARLDAALAQRYQSIRKNLAPSAAPVFVTNQRLWTQQRTHSCPDTSATCLIGLYQARIDAFDALLAQTSDDNPSIEASEPVALEGTWQVTAFNPAEAPTKLKPLSWVQPTIGTTLAFKVGEMCTTEPPLSRPQCEAFGLISIEPGPLPEHLARQLDLPAAAPRFLTMIHGKADFELILRERDSSLITNDRVCDEIGKHCEDRYRLWKPVGKPANIRRFHLF